jgi:ankyrin repeat protein
MVARARDVPPFFIRTKVRNMVIDFWKKLFGVDKSPIVPESEAPGAICHAAGDGDLATLKALLRRYPQLVSTHFDYGKTTLHWAVEKGHKNVVEFLLAKGADVNAEDHVGQTATLYAEGKGFAAIEKLLRQHGGYARSSERRRN